MSRIHEHRGLLEQEPEIRRQLEGLHWTDLDSYRRAESGTDTENTEVKPCDNETVASQRAELDDDELVSLFSELHKHDLRYTAEWGRWNEWDGRRWKTDNKLHAHHLGRLVCRLARRKYPQSQMGNRITSSLTMAAVERWARADPQHAITPAQWDADPWLLNTPAGTVDLRNGVLRPAASADYCTKITAVAPGGECPLWMTFLARITDGDPGLQEFIQRMCGYALTGETREHALFFLYGTGANGKSVFLNTISDVMGDYAQTAPMESFIASSNEHHPTELAGLQGARLVFAVETEDGRRWAESKIKALTSGERISARFMRQDFFQFVPQFKLVIAGNHKPGLRTVDEAIRRRFHLLPFSVTIPAEQRDKELGEKLRQEGSGILRWAIDGCLAWQREGLKPPCAVTEATGDYLEAEDGPGRWIEECCIVGWQYSTATAALFSNWREWCDRNGEFVGSQRRFSQSLEARKFKRHRSSTARSFIGLALKADFT